MRHSQRRQTHQLRGVSKLQDRLPTIRGTLLLHLRRRGRQQSHVSGGDPQLRRSSQRVFPQRLRIGLGFQFLQSLLGRRRNVLGRRNQGNQSNESPQTVTNALFVGVARGRVWRPRSRELM